jgi:hypothetical protein
MCGGGKLGCGYVGTGRCTLVGVLRRRRRI